MLKMNKKDFERARNKALEKWQDVLLCIEENRFKEGFRMIPKYCGFCNYYDNISCYTVRCQRNCPMKKFDICGTERENNLVEKLCSYIRKLDDVYYDYNIPFDTKEELLNKISQIIYEIESIDYEKDIMEYCVADLCNEYYVQGELTITTPKVDKELLLDIVGNKKFQTVEEFKEFIEEWVFDDIFSTLDYYAKFGLPDEDLVKICGLEELFEK